MKKLVLCLAVLLCGFATASAQSDQHLGSYKANDLVRKADGLLQKRTSESYEQAQQLYKDAEKQLNADIEKAKANDKNDKLALLYLQNADLQNKLLNPEMTRASQGMAFDTLQFCNFIDKIINSFNTAETYNKMPNAKGKVKVDNFVTLRTKLGISSMLNLYYNCGAFMDAMGKKKESLEYFEKFVNLPKVSPVFSETERDSIYKASYKIYSQARFNLALQNFYLKDWKKTLECCNEALKDTVGLNDLYLIKINALGEMKDSVEWQKTILEAYKRTGKESYMQNLIYYYMQSNKVAEAEKLANNLVQNEPNNKMAWFIKGAIELNVKKDYKAAIESCDKALAIDPNFKDALFNKGTAYINDIYDQTHSAKNKFKYIGKNTRITGKASDGSYQRNKAIYDKEISYVRSYYENARICMEKFRELAPEDVKRWASPLQMCYSSLGLTAKAKEMDALLEAANKAGK